MALHSTSFDASLLFIASAGPRIAKFRCTIQARSAINLALHVAVGTLGRMLLVLRSGFKFTIQSIVVSYLGAIMAVSLACTVADLQPADSASKVLECLVQAELTDIRLIVRPSTAGP